MKLCPSKEQIILSFCLWHCFRKEDQWLLPPPYSKLAVVWHACSQVAQRALGGNVTQGWQSVCTSLPLRSVCGGPFWKSPFQTEMLHCGSWYFLNDCITSSVFSKLKIRGLSLTGLCGNVCFSDYSYVKGLATMRFTYSSCQHIWLGFRIYF